MRRVFTSLTVVVFAVCIIAWCAPVMAQNNAAEAGAVVSHPAYFTAPGEAMPNSVNAFGTNVQWTTLHVSDWTPWVGSATPNYVGGTGYVYTAASGDALWTQVNIPVGAQVNYLIWLYYDNDPACYWYLNFHKYEAGAAGANPGYTSIDLQATTASDVPGYVQLNVDFTADPPVIRSWEDINASAGPHYASYNLSAEQLGCGGTSNMRFWGAAFNWSRVISPAPSGASFSDVGTGYWAFQAIEALSASGITTGYADGTFRPQNTVTRAEMATFLARALGLHYPY